MIWNFLKCDDFIISLSSPLQPQFEITWGKSEKEWVFMGRFNVGSVSGMVNRIAYFVYVV